MKDERYMLSDLVVKTKQIHRGEDLVCRCEKARECVRSPEPGAPPLEAVLAG